MLSHMNTTSSTRTTGLRQMLLERRRAMQTAVNNRIRDSRADRSNEVRDMVDQCDVGVAEELSFALLQIRTEAPVGVDAALARLDDGTYGVCSDCGSEIVESRLHAMPFAVRCTRCEETSEQARRRQQQGERLSARPLFSEFTGA
jgi:DnaK suppressor protein